MELRKILEILWRRKWIAINIFAAIFLTVVIGSLLITPWYDSTAKVLIRNSSAASSLLSSLGLQSGSSGQSSISDTDRADYLALASVRPVLDKVISEQHITRERTRARIMRSIPFMKPLLRFLGVDVEATEEVMTAERLLDPALLSYIFPAPSVSVDQYEETDIIEIKATSPDREQAMKIANGIANAFIEGETKRAREDYKGAKGFIDENIEKAKLGYVNALEALKDFKEKEKTVNLDTETTNLIQKISDLKKNMEDNNLAIFKTRASIEKIESQLKSIPRYEKASEQIKDNEMVQSLKLTLRDLYLDLAASKTKYTKDHPNVVDIQNKIDQTKDLIQKEMSKVFASETTSVNPLHETILEKLTGYYADIAAYESQNQIFPKIISRYETELMTLPRKSSTSAQLNLAVTVTQDVYDSLLQYQYQVGIAESMALSNIYLVEPSITPDINDSKHRSPDLLLNAIIAIMLGTIFGIGAALMSEYLDDTIRTPNDVREFKTLIFLGSIIKLKNRDPRLISAMDPRSPLVESFRTIRNSIRFATLDKPAKRIVITSSIEREGKSFMTANLAISLVNDGKKVVILDGDMRRPAMHSYFNLTNSSGLTNFLLGDKGMQDIQLAVGLDGLRVIPTGPIPPDPARLVGSKKMQELLKDAEENYDMVIIDTPPLSVASDAIVLGEQADAVVFVIESGRASRSHFSETIDLISKANINLVVAVLNKVAREGVSYYYYRYKYHKYLPE